MAVRSGWLQPTALLLRQRFSIAAFCASWFDAGYPEGLFSPEEMEFGIHAGAIETSMMRISTRAWWRRISSPTSPPAAGKLDAEFRLIQSDPGGGRLGGFGWMMQDLHPPAPPAKRARRDGRKG